MEENIKPFPVPSFVSVICGVCGVLVIGLTLHEMLINPFYIEVANRVLGWSWILIPYLGKVILIPALAALAVGLLLMRKAGTAIQRITHLFALFLLPVSIVVSFRPLSTAIKHLPEDISEIFAKKRPFKVEVKLETLESGGDLSAKDVEDYKAVLESRLSRINVSWSDWQDLGEGKFSMEIKGKLDESGIPLLFENHAVLFLETYEFNAGWSTLEEINQILRRYVDTTEVTMNMPQDGVDNDSTFMEDPLHPRLEPEEDPELAREKFKRENPLLGMLTMMPPDQINPNHPLIGYISEADTARFMGYLKSPDARSRIPKDQRFLFSMKPSGIFNDELEEKFFDLVVVKDPPYDLNRLDNSFIVEARWDFDNQGPIISFNFNEEGAEKWERMTATNVGHCIAIVLDGEVISYPNVQSRIEGGQSQITGSFTMEEAQDIAFKLKSGTLPLKSTVVSIEPLN